MSTKHFDYGLPAFCVGQAMNCISAISLLVDVAGIEPAFGTFAFAAVATNHFHAQKVQLSMQILFEYF